MIIINHSAIIAELLPEITYSLDPDVPVEDELSLEAKKFIKALLMRAFHRCLSEEYSFDMRWLLRIRQDVHLSHLSDRVWLDVEVMDTEGTYLLIFEDL